MELNESIVAVPLTQSGGASTVSMNDDNAIQKSPDESQKTPGKTSRASSDVWNFIESNLPTYMIMFPFQPSPIFGQPSFVSVSRQQLGILDSILSISQCLIQFAFIVPEFTRETDGHELCRCKPCASVGVEKLWKSKNTDTFRGHLQKKHCDLYARKKVPSEICPSLLSSLCELGQLFSNRKRKRESEKEDINHVAREKLRSFILASSVSPSLVELPEFVEFCSLLNSSFRLPSSETVHEWLLENNPAYEHENHTLAGLQAEWNSVSRKLSRAELKLSQALCGTEQKKDLHDEVMRLSAYKTSINHRIAAMQSAELGKQQ